jgi:hypothetical protein
MGKNVARRHLKRPSMFAVAFGWMLGLVAVGYGSIMLFLRPAGTGPCRVNCDLEQAFLTFLGQPLYNLLFGLTWVALGLALIVLLTYARVRR